MNSNPLRSLAALALAAAIVAPTCALGSPGVPLRFSVTIAEASHFVRVLDADRDGLLSAGDTLLAAARYERLEREDLATDESVAAAFARLRGAPVAVFSYSGRRAIVAQGTPTDSGGVSVTRRSGETGFAPASVEGDRLPAASTLIGAPETLARYVSRRARTLAPERSPLRVFAMDGAPAWKKRWLVSSYHRNYAGAVALLRVLR